MDLGKELEVEPIKTAEKPKISGETIRTLIKLFFLGFVPIVHLVLGFMFLGICNDRLFYKVLIELFGRE